MRRRRVLIVEDDPMVALDLEAIVVGATNADVAVAQSVKEASRVLREAVFDAALLDIDVLDGKTFPVAHLLAERGTPFAFVSGARREDVPLPLRQVPFLPKPYDPQDIERKFLARLAHQG
jgi:DNA-binding response OmpR family regulator